MRGGGAAGRGAVMDASAALRANLDAEGRVITDFSAWFTCRLLTPLQHARCNATCYPYMVRCALRCLHVVAATDSCSSGGILCAA
jgi:hypothetical protein